MSPAWYKWFGPLKIDFGIVAFFCFAFINSRSLHDLHPSTECKAAGMSVSYGSFSIHQEVEDEMDSLNISSDVGVVLGCCGEERSFLFKSTFQPSS